MAELNGQHMVDEIKVNIETGDSLKARPVPDHLASVDKKTQNRLLYELSRADAGFTVPLLNHVLSTFPDLAGELPVIMVTTQGDVQDHDAAKEAGVDDILIKPFNADTLRVAMSQFITVPN